MVLLGQTIHRVLPSRPCRRSLGLLILWTCFCWLVFRISKDEHILPSYYQGGEFNMNTRELLGRIMTGKAENIKLSTPVTMGSTTENSEINNLQAVPSIDRSPKLSEADLVIKLQPQMPNLPIVYWQENKKKKVNKNASCTKYPDIYDLHFNNQY